MITVPERFRSPVRAVVQRLVDRDYEGLARDGVVVGGGDIGYWIEDYPAVLASLPDEAWDLSKAGHVEGRPGCYWFVLDLWTAEEGRSDLSMEGEILETADGITVLVHDVHVL